jgi:hypothetical protein
VSNHRPHQRWGVGAGNLCRQVIFVEDAASAVTLDRAERTLNPPSPA